MTDFTDTASIQFDFSEATTPIKLDFTMEESGGSGGKYPDYTGSYTVTPKVTEQKLATKDKSMNDDVTIYQIPYHEVTNPSGGTTITIGLE